MWVLGRLHIDRGEGYQGWEGHGGRTESVKASVKTYLSVSEVRLTLLVLKTSPLILYWVGEVALNHIHKQVMKTTWLFDIHVWLTITSVTLCAPVKLF